MKLHSLIPNHVQEWYEKKQDFQLQAIGWLKWTQLHNSHWAKWTFSWKVSIPLVNQPPKCLCSGVLQNTARFQERSCKTFTLIQMAFRDLRHIRLKGCKRKEKHWLEPSEQHRHYSKKYRGITGFDLWCKVYYFTELYFIKCTSRFF